VKGNDFAMIKRKSPGRSAAAGARTSASSSAQDPALARVRELAAIATEFDLGEIELDPAGRIRISRMRVSAPAPAAPVAHAAPGTPTLVKSPPAEDADTAFVVSPFVGTFYRAPSPEADAFADVGTVVRKGQVVCIIEAMKLMNEIESEVDGKVVEVLANNGEHVEYGQKLFRVAKG
jgi:acetyl-CoA carboxylase biotin carboxyl carrier protein